jgi:mono/diheme cytochrome c family protein
MQRLWTSLFAAAAAFLAAGAISQNTPPSARPPKPSSIALSLHNERKSPLDLEVAGELAGLPSGTTRYMTREDLLALPQTTFIVKNDANFRGPTQVTGVLLEELIRTLGSAPGSDMVVAICDDQYRANYPQAYVAAHRPLLVLKINGKPPADWPKDSEGHGLDMGPYMISHPKFLPSFKTSKYGDEAQIPWGVVRLEFRNEQTVFGAIAPRGPHADDESVQHGYQIARQNCFRCHNSDKEGGTKAGRAWPVLSAWATTSPVYFTAYVRNPQSKNPKAQMPGNPSFDDKIMSALTAYFQTFPSSGQ